VGTKRLAVAGWRLAMKSESKVRQQGARRPSKGASWVAEQGSTPMGPAAQGLKGSRAPGLNRSILEWLNRLQGPRATHNTAFSHALSSNLHTVQAFKAANHAPRMAAGLRMGEPSRGATRPAAWAPDALLLLDSAASP